MDRENGTAAVIDAAEKLNDFDTQNRVSIMFAIPDKSDFDAEFLDAPELKKIGEFLIEKYPNDFGHLEQANVIYLWKEKGGESGGRATLGKCIRPTGLAKFFACKADSEITEKVDYFVWAAADHLRDNRANHRTICALIFHELKHTSVQDGKFVVVDHEFEGFAREIEEFGMWQSSIKRIAEACETVKDVQHGLFTNL